MTDEERMRDEKENIEKLFLYDVKAALCIGNNISEKIFLKEERRRKRLTL